MKISDEEEKQILKAFQNSKVSMNFYTDEGEKMFGDNITWSIANFDRNGNVSFSYSSDHTNMEDCKIIEKSLSKKPKTYQDLIPQRIIFNEPATIVFWNDGTKTIVRCAKGEKFIPEVGVAEAIVKKVFGGTRRGRERFLRLVKKATWQDNLDKK